MYVGEWGVCVRGVCEYGKDWGGLNDVTMIIVPLQVFYPHNNQPYFFFIRFYISY